MKLLFCPKCDDLVKLRVKARRCSCGACSGRYLSADPDETRAVVRGPKVQIVGFDSYTFSAAMIRAMRLKSKLGADDYWLPEHMFFAWVFGPNALAVTRQSTLRTPQTASHVPPDAARVSLLAKAWVDREVVKLKKRRRSR